MGNMKPPIPWYAKILLTNDWQEISNLAGQQIHYIAESELENPDDILNSFEYKELENLRRQKVEALLLLNPTNPLIIDAYSDCIEDANLQLKLKTEAIKLLLDYDEDNIRELQTEINALKSQLGTN